MKEYPDYILYRGSRDELNLLCKEKDDEITKLKETIKSIAMMLETEIDYEVLRNVVTSIASELDKQGETIS
jgi:hypothetical protein